MRTLYKDVVDSNKPWKYVTGHRSCMGHRNLGKYRTGPGGINCPCCCKVHPRELKVLSRRAERRKDKQNINKDID